MCVFVVVVWLTAVAPAEDVPEEKYIPRNAPGEGSRWVGRVKMMY